MSHRDTKWANAVEQMELIGLIDARLPHSICKKTVSVKCNKVKRNKVRHNKMRCVYIAK